MDEKQAQKMLKVMLGQIDKESSSSKDSSLKIKSEIYQLFHKGEDMRVKEKVDEAIVYLNKAKKMNAELGDQLLEALILESLGFCYRTNNEYEKAIKMATDAIDIFKHLSGRSGQLGIANGHISLGNIYYKLGKPHESISYTEKAIKVLLSLRDGYSLFSLEVERHLGIAIGNMGEVHNQILQHEKAIELCQEALKISQKNGYKFEEARCLQNIGNAYYGLQKFVEAIMYSEKGLRLFKEIGNLKGMSSCYCVLGSSHMSLGRTDTSDRYYNICIDIKSHMKQFDDLAIVYGNKGLLYYKIALLKFISRFSEAKESLVKSIETFKMAIESTERVLATISVDTNRTAFTDRFYRWYDCLTSPFILLGRSTAALLFLDLGRAKILRYLVYKQSENQEEDDVRSDFESTWQTIENGKEKEIMSALSRDIQLPESDAIVLFYNFNDAKVLTIWVLDANGCVSLKTSDPSRKSTTSHQEMEEHINMLLGKESTGIPRKYSFLKEPNSFSTEFEIPNVKVKQSTSTQYPNEGNPKAVKSHEHAHKETKVMDSADKYRPPAKHPDESCDDLGKASCSFLYKSLIDPVKNMIIGTKLIIVPQRCLFFTPFSSLLDENGCLLSEKYEIQIIPSIHVLAISMKSSKSVQIGGSLFVGNPELKNSRLESLPSAEDEVKYLASLLDGKPLTGRAATKRKVTELISTTSIIHIAAHGHQETGHIFLAPESGVRLASSTDLLTQSDILKCKLSARLVVLSCCHTGMGKLSSEGVLGIARSFLGAGAHSVLVTLWSIDDMFTMQFMKIFYEKIFEEKPVCLALKETINHFQRSGQYTSFLFWAAFEILGEDVKFTKSELEQIRRKNKDMNTSN